jgi:hypothetical protein
MQTLGVVKWSGKSVLAIFFMEDIRRCYKLSFFVQNHFSVSPWTMTRNVWMILDFRFGNAWVQNFGRRNLDEWLVQVLPVCEHPSVPLFGAVSVMETSSKDRVFFCKPEIR